jgi:predicted Rossmann fold nucleotide-binding protein DprA/Smf involved in DNA uptake
VLLAILAEGHLRLYEADEGEVTEWGRLRLRSALDPEALARLTLDLAHLTGGNGVTSPVTSAPKALPPGAGIAGHILAALGDGPLTVAELHAAVGRGYARSSVSTELSRMKKLGQVHRVPPQRWALGPEPERRAGRARSGEARAAILGELAAGPATRAEIAGHLGWDAKRVGSTLNNLLAAGLVRHEAGERWALTGA